MIYIPKHFGLKEIFPKIMVETLTPLRLWSMMDEGLMRDVDNLREYFNRDVYVNYNGMQCRGFRDCEICGDVGAKYSPHRLGRALDLTVYGLTAEEVRQHILNNQSKYPHIKRMEKGVSWTHIDSLSHNRKGIYLFNG